MQQINHVNLREKNWVEIHDDARGTYNKDSQAYMIIGMHINL